MALRMIDHGTKEYEQMINLRNEILRKPIGLHFEPDELEKEKEDILMGAYEDEKTPGVLPYNKSRFRNREASSNGRS